MYVELFIPQSHYLMTNSLSQLSHKLAYVFKHQIVTGIIIGFKYFSQIFSVQHRQVVATRKQLLIKTYATSISFRSLSLWDFAPSLFLDFHVVFSFWHLIYYLKFCFLNLWLFQVKNILSWRGRKMARVQAGSKSQPLWELEQRSLKNNLVKRKMT